MTAVTIKQAAFRLENFDGVALVAAAFQSGAVVDLRLDEAPDREAWSCLGLRFRTGLRRRWLH